MNDQVLEQVKQRIARSYREQHPLKRNSTGIDNFSYVYYITRDKSPEWIQINVLPDIDKLLGDPVMAHCHSCRMKLLVYAMSICQDKLPEEESRYGCLYKQSVEQAREDLRDRDYIEEVYFAMERFKSSYKENAWRYEIAK